MWFRIFLPLRHRFAVTAVPLILFKILEAPVVLACQEILRIHAKSETHYVIIVVAVMDKIKDILLLW